MTAGDENAGLHKRWLERKLEIEVGKVAAKLLSKGLSVPVPDPEVLETEARLSQSHLPKLYIELYGRNPNGTHKLLHDPNKRNGPLPPATVVQKLDRMLNPALLTPIPIDIVTAHGLPLSCCDSGDLFTSSGTLPTSRGGSGAGRGGSSAHGRQQQQQQQGQSAHGGGMVTESGAASSGSPRVSRSPAAVQSTCRPDLQAVDGRIDDAVAEVHRVALQANEMSPRERVLYLAREANPNFSLPPPRSVQLAAMAAAAAAGASRKGTMLRKSFSRRITNFTAAAEPGAEPGGGGGGGGRPQRLQPSASRRSMGSVDNRRSREPSATSLPLVSSCPTGGATGGEGSLPPLASRSRSVSRASSSSHEPAALAAAAAAAEHAAAAAAVAALGPEEAEALPRLSPSVSPVQSAAVVSGELEAEGRGSLSPLPKLPSLRSGGETAASGAGRASLTAVKMPESLVGEWGAAAIVHAAAVASARQAARAEALAETEAEAEAAAAAEAEAEAAAEAAEAALEAEVEAEARAAAGLLSQSVTVADGAAEAVAPAAARRVEHQQHASAGARSAHQGVTAAAAAAGRGGTHGSVAAHHEEVQHGGSHLGSSWMP